MVDRMKVLTRDIMTRGVPRGKQRQSGETAVDVRWVHGQAFERYDMTTRQAVYHAQLSPKMRPLPSGWC